MPRDSLSDSLAVLRIPENDDEENWTLAEKTYKQNNEKPREPLPNGDECNNKNFACYYNYGLGDGGANQYHNPIIHYKTNSLPAASHFMQSWENAVCSSLRIPAEDIAKQITLLDLECFKAIQPAELTTCSWTKPNKAIVAPNVVAFTKRFNRVSFWTVQEILNGSSPKQRGESLCHFIKVAKKLQELNNLHSLFAVISALHSASVFRLNKSWACLSKKDKLLFDKLAEIFAEKANWTALRDVLKNSSLPCIPYLGIFLTDLVYIDIAHPTGSLHREEKMEMVLQNIQRYQASEYNIYPKPQVANFLNSIRYIEELQKFLEDDQYKLSLKLEPNESRSGSKESVKDSSAAHTPYNTSPNRRHGSGSLCNGSCGQSKFIPTHRKCRSLGSNIFSKSHTEDKIDDITPAGSVNLLDDTVLESPGCTPGEQSTAILMMGTLITSKITEEVFQSFVRRKTVLKDGRKPPLSSWQRYWIQLCENNLIYYSSKSFKGTRRSDFKNERCKVMCLDGWHAMKSERECSDIFQLINNQNATLYKFKTGSEVTAQLWITEIDKVTNKPVKPLPVNLINL